MLKGCWAFWPTASCRSSQHFAGRKLRILSTSTYSLALIISGTTERTWRPRLPTAAPKCQRSCRQYRPNFFRKNPISSPSSSAQQQGSKYGPAGWVEPGVMWIMVTILGRWPSLGGSTLPRDANLLYFWGWDSFEGKLVGGAFASFPTWLMRAAQ